MVSQRKIVECVKYSDRTGKPFFLVVRFAQGIYWAKVTHSKYEAGFGGRTDRNDPNDLEPVLYLPIKEFNPL